MQRSISAVDFDPVLISYPSPPLVQNLVVQVSIAGKTEQTINSVGWLFPLLTRNMSVEVHRKDLRVFFTSKNLGGVFGSFSVFESTLYAA